MNISKQLKEGKMNMPLFWLTVVLIWVIQIMLYLVGVDFSKQEVLPTWRLMCLLITLVIWFVAVAFRLRDAGKSPYLAALCIVFPIFALIAGIFPSAGEKEEAEEADTRENII